MCKNSYIYTILWTPTPLRGHRGSTWTEGPGSNTIAWCYIFAIAKIFRHPLYVVSKGNYIVRESHTQCLLLAMLSHSHAIVCHDSTSNYWRFAHHAYSIVQQRCNMATYYITIQSDCLEIFSGSFPFWKSFSRTQVNVRSLIHNSYIWTAVHTIIDSCNSFVS